jgi:hypothetical protein
MSDLGSDEPPLCAHPGCKKEVWIDSDGNFSKYCGRTHLLAAAKTIDAKLVCMVSTSHVARALDTQTMSSGRIAKRSLDMLTPVVTVRTYSSPLRVMPVETALKRTISAAFAAQTHIHLPVLIHRVPERKKVLPTLSVVSLNAVNPYLSTIKGMQENSAPIYIDGKLGSYVKREARSNCHCCISSEKLSRTGYGRHAYRTCLCMDLRPA